MQNAADEPRIRDSKGDMNKSPKVTEINISKQARALAWLRLTDYVMVVICGFAAIGVLSEVVVSIRAGDAGMLVVELILSAILCFLAYAGWRHHGVIDPAIWRAYHVIFPLLSVLCLLTVLLHVSSLLVTYTSLSDFMEQKGKIEFAEEFNGLVVLIWTGSMSLLGWISLRLLRRTKILAMDSTVGHVLLRLTVNADVRAVEKANIKRINKPRGLAIGAAGSLILLAYILSPLPRNEIWAEFILRNNHFIMPLGFFLLVWAERYFQFDADSLLAVDKRPPIVFLRSFADDEKQHYLTSTRAFLDFSLEYRLFRHFFRFGPFVAIGSPNETVPSLGAARVRLSEDEWQPRVLRWIRDAKLIIMYSGKTYWVNWELRQVVGNECATRLILMIPEIKTWRRWRRDKEILARMEQVRDAFKSTPWEDELLKFNDFAELRAMLFRPDGSMVMIKSRSRSRDSYHLAALVAHRVLIDPDVLKGDHEDVQKADEARQGGKSEALPTNNNA